MTHKLVGFADGENLVLRYQAMVANGAKPRSDVIHIPDVLAWHPRIMSTYVSDVIRVLFYQTCVGDDRKIFSVMQQIKEIRYVYQDDTPTSENCSGALIPKVFKKEKRSSKTKSVDINLTVDMLRCVYHSPIDVLFLLSGDGDYLPLIEEASRSGKQVWLAAFSDGLHSGMALAADEFIDLDKVFFEEK
jgi:uncharacterized protein (TIGR00288 family)